MSVVTRIAILGHTAELGGAELALVRLLDAARGPDLDVRVVLFADGPLVGRLRESGHDVEVLPLDPRVAQLTRHAAGAAAMSQLRTAFLLVPFVIRLVRRVRALDVDVVQSNTLKADLIAVPVGLLSGKPLVWWVHDRIEADYLPRTMVRFVRFVACRFPRVVVCNSLATAASLPGARGVVVAYPGVASDEIRAGERPRPSGPAVVGIVGRISETKGQLEFVRAAAIVARDLPGTQFRIVGSAMFGQEDYERRVRAEVRRLGLTDVVEFTGFVVDPLEEIDRFTVCVHASGTPEPFGQVIIQSMVRGVPVVATRGGGVKEILEPAQGRGPLGWLVPPRDVDALAQTILAVLHSPAEARDRARAAHAWATRHFTIATTAATLKEAWVASAASGRPPRLRRRIAPHA